MRLRKLRGSVLEQRAHNAFIKLYGPNGIVPVAGQIVCRWCYHKTTTPETIEGSAITALPCIHNTLQATTPVGTVVDLVEKLDRDVDAERNSRKGKQ